MVPRPCLPLASKSCTFSLIVQWIKFQYLLQFAKVVLYVRSGIVILFHVYINILFEEMIILQPLAKQICNFHLAKKEKQIEKRERERDRKRTTGETNSQNFQIDFLR